MGQTAFLSTMIFDPDEIDREYMSRTNWLKRLLLRGVPFLTSV